MGGRGEDRGRDLKRFIFEGGYGITMYVVVAMRG